MIFIHVVSTASSERIMMKGMNVMRYTIPVHTAAKLADVNSFDIM